MKRQTFAALVWMLAGLVHASPAPQSQLEYGRHAARAGHFDVARGHFIEALSAFRDQSNAQGEARALIALGNLLRRTGSGRQAVRRIDAALAILDGRDDPALRARALSERGQAHGVAGAYDAARSDFDTAREIYRALQSPGELAELDAAASVVAAWAGRYATAIRLAERAIGALQAHGRTEAALRARFARAYALQHTERVAEALHSYNRIVPSAFEQGDQVMLTAAYCNRAEAQRVLGMRALAEPQLRRAIAELEMQRARVPGTGADRTRFLDRQIAAYSRLILLLADTSRGEQGFEVAERFRARSFLEQLDRPARERAVGDPELARRELGLVEAIGQLLTGAQANDPGSVQTKLTELETELAAVRTQIAARRPAYRLIAPPEPVALSEISRALAPDEALVAYWLTEDRLLAWTATATATGLTQAPAGHESLVRDIRTYLRPLRDPERARDQALAGEEWSHLETGQRLYRWLIAPLPEAVRKAARIRVVASGPLHYLPLEALPARCQPSSADAAVHAAYAACTYPGLEQGWSYLPSAAVWLALRQRESPAQLSPAAFAPELGAARLSAARRVTGAGPGFLRPLAGAGNEAQVVIERLGGGTLRRGAGATEANLKQEGPRYGILHFAGHAIVQDAHPLSSGILLRAGGGDDGLLQASEVMNLSLDAGLVTLSACRTARGQLSHGAGIVGLAQAFHYAGADAVLASLWDVDDTATARLMRAFYDGLARGMERDFALQHARTALFHASGETKLVARTRPMRYAHPRFWAAFRLSGLP